MAFDRTLGFITAQENFLFATHRTHHLWFEQANWVTAKLTVRCQWFSCAVSVVFPLAFDYEDGECYALRILHNVYRVQELSKIAKACNAPCEL
jgi:hypothetical protein